MHSSLVHAISIHCPAPFLPGPNEEGTDQELAAKSINKPGTFVISLNGNKSHPVSVDIGWNGSGLPLGRESAAFLAEPIRP